MMRPAPQKESRASADRPEAVAFVEDESSRELIGRALSEFMFSNVGIRRGSISTAISQLAEQRSPRLLIVDISNVDLPLSSIAELAEVCEPGVTVVAIGDRNDVGLFRELINSGIRDYLVKPLTYQLLHRSLLNIVQDVALPKQTTNLGRVTVFLGARGGVGTTTLATSCGWEIARQRHRRVGLLDLDLHFGSAALALDLDPSHVLREALDDPGRIDGLFVDRAMMKHSPMFYVLAGEEPLSEMVPLGRAGIELVVAELRAKFHYVLVDMPRSVNEANLHTIAIASNLILVTDLSLAGMRYTLRLLELVRQLNSSCAVRVVANRVGEYRSGSLSRRDFEGGIGRRVDLCVPFERRAVAEATNAGSPAAAVSKALSGPLSELAASIAGPGNTRGSNWFTKLLATRR